MKYLIGKVLDVKEGEIVVETLNEIGLKITTLNSDNYTLNKKYKIFTFEESKIWKSYVITNIFGFLNEIHLEIFKVLISIKGIGSKKALAMMNKNIREFISILCANDYDVEAIKQMLVFDNE